MKNEMNFAHPRTDTCGLSLDVYCCNICVTDVEGAEDALCRDASIQRPLLCQGLLRGHPAHPRTDTGRGRLHPLQDGLLRVTIIGSFTSIQRNVSNPNPANPKFREIQTSFLGNWKLNNTRKVNENYLFSNNNNN